MRTGSLAAVLLVSLVLLSSLVAAQTAPTLSVDVAAGRHAISPDIYGIANYGLDASFAKEIKVPNVRWGGDGTTRYNWLVDSSNSGFDWYFMGGSGEAKPIAGAGVDKMVTTYGDAGARSLVSVPIIPFVNKSATMTCSFRVSVYGAQQASNPYAHPSGEDCGNSLSPDGKSQLIDKDIYYNHIDNSVELQRSWIQHLVEKFGQGSKGGVPYYELDNEPSGWGNTHRDVLPKGADYSQIVALGKQYAAMIKQVDPTAKVLGPGDFTLGGWIGDTAKQNGLFGGQYYLREMAAYEKKNGVRVIDYFDEHYYGEGHDEASQLASTRTLWDPTYNGGTWVEQHVFKSNMRLIPRFREWIAAYYPGLKLSLSEYSFTYCNGCSKTGIVAALTQADVLGIFGREGLDLANMWDVPKPTEPVAFSFRLYRNFDGTGGQYGDTWVKSTSTDERRLSIYGAQRSSDRALTLVVINKTPADIQTTISITNFPAKGKAAVYRYSNAKLTDIVKDADVVVSPGPIGFKFPAYSATVIVVPVATKPKSR